MNFLRRMGNSWARFMYGRNGVDQLNYALLILGLVLCVAEAILKWEIISVLTTVLWIVVMFRMFSRNIYKRRAENAKWTKFWYGFRHRMGAAKARHDDKEHKYFTCSNCKAICRVPAGKGKIVITCPKCGQEIHGKS